MGTDYPALQEEFIPRQSAHFLYQEGNTMHTRLTSSTTSRSLPLLIVLAAFAVAAVAAQISAQQINTSNPASATPAQVKIKRTPIRHVPVNAGQKMYVAYCASCHGDSGKGDGVAAPALNHKPTDLTLLSARNNGRFPSHRVEYLLKVDEGQASHGPADMPNWCPAFHSLDKDHLLTRHRVHALIAHLRTMQVPNPNAVQAQ
jgi:mono/diheme cytochrome c family protein